MGNILNSALHWAEWLGFHQRRCAFCLHPFYPGELIHSGKLSSLRLCPMCQKLLSPYEGPVCHACGLPNGSETFLENGDDSSSRYCMQCKKSRPPWHKFAYHGLYTGALRDILLRFKFNGEIQLGNLLGEFLFNVSKCLPRPDMVLAIPQTSSKLRRRGYNQAHEIAAAFGKLANMRISTQVLVRTGNAIPQEGLDANQRRENLKGVFKSSSCVKNKTIWLVDDVMTTGSTLSSACNALYAGGAKEVHALFIARTPLN